MKNASLLLIFSMLLSASGFAQITITQADMPVIGDMQANVNAEVTAGLSVGSSGANQTWDFSGLLPVDTIYTEFLDPALAPEGNLFPTATLAFGTADEYTYIEANSSGAYLLGFTADTSGMGDYFSLALDNPEQFFEFPTTYGTSFSAERKLTLTFESPDPPFDSVRIITHGYKDVEFDGFGTVITPMGSFDGLREVAIIEYFDTIQGYILGMWQTTLTDNYSDTTYTWYSKDSKGPLVNATLFEGMIAEISYQILEPAAIAPVAAFSFEDQGQGAIDFTDESTNAPTSWQWDFGDGNASMDQNPSHTYDETGMYEVCLTATNAGGSDMTCQTLDITVTSVNTLIENIQLELFPNPASDWLRLTISGSESKDCDFVLYNALGQVVFSQKTNGDGQFDMDIRHLDTGLYHFVLNAENGKLLANGSVVKKAP